MQVLISQGVRGARTARGVVVVIDVFNASTTAITALAQGATSVLAVSDIAQAKALKNEHAEWLFVGEKTNRDTLESIFDVHNSSYDLLHYGDKKIAGNMVVLSTLSGTRVMAEAVNNPECDSVLTCGFSNLKATVQQLRNLGADVVTLVPVGGPDGEYAPEDSVCAMYLKNELEGFPNVIDALTHFLEGSESAGRFWGDKAQNNEADFYTGISLDSVPFAVALETDGADMARMKKLEE